MKAEDILRKTAHRYIWSKVHRGVYIYITTKFDREANSFFWSVEIHTKSRKEDNIINALRFGLADRLRKTLDAANLARYPVIVETELFTG